MKTLAYLIIPGILLTSCNSATKENDQKLAKQQATIDSMKQVLAKQAVIDSMKTVFDQEKETLASKSEDKIPQQISENSSPPSTPRKKKGLNHTAKGAIVGAGAGAITGAIVRKEDRAKGALIGSVIGAGVGAGTGAIVDAQKKKSERKNK